MRRRLAIAGAALALASGCGGGDGDETPEPTDFTSQADAVCLETQLKLQQLPQPTTVPELGEFAKRFTPIAREQIAALSKLEPPAAQRAQFTRFLDGLRDAARAIDRLGAAARARNEARVQQLLRGSERANALTSRLARDLGLTVCSPNQR